MSRGYVVAEHEVEARPESGTAAARLMIDRSCGCERLEQRILTFAPGRSDERATGERQEVLFVAAGSGSLRLGEETHALEPNTGAFLVPGDRYAIENPGPEELELVSVSAPCEGERRSRVTVRYADRPVLPASPNREFRFLVNEDTGCLDVTQFVGVIPPGPRADAQPHLRRGRLHRRRRGRPPPRRPGHAARAGNVHPPSAARGALPREHRADPDAGARRLPSVRGPGVACACRDTQRVVRSPNRGKPKGRNYEEGRTVPRRSRTRGRGDPRRPYVGAGLGGFPGRGQEDRL